jgi:outer membrane protein OmpA-like peptidoglycan-associated protein
MNRVIPLIEISVTVICVLIFAQLTAGREDRCEEARLLYRRGTELLDYEARKNVFLQAVALCPSYAEAHVNLADSLENLEDYEAAEQHYREGLRLRPDLLAPHIGLAEVYLKTGRFGLAEEAFRKGLLVRPDNRILREGLGIVLQHLKRERSVYLAEQIRACFSRDDGFRVMCMCPVSRYRFLRRWFCIPPVFFAGGSSWLTRKAERRLDEIGSALASEALRGRKWLLVGHADARGPAPYNLRLSKKRAERVKAYLVEKFGISPRSLRLIFFGHKRPRATNTTADGRSQNRRVEIVEAK